jgi:hypothetical protein
VKKRQGQRKENNGRETKRNSELREKNIWKQNICTYIEKVTEKGGNK